MTPHVLVTGDCREILRRLPEKIVQCVWTSPPYWGLRKYDGVEPSVWGGDSECLHEWGVEQIVRGPAQVQGATSARKGRSNIEAQIQRGVAQGSYCQLCGAWRGCLGNEPTPDQYVTHLVEVFREVRRVLRDDGVLWLNLGDSYVSNGRYDEAYEAKRNRGGTHANDAEKYARFNPRTGAKAAGLKFKDLVMIPETTAMALRADGWYLRSKAPWVKRACLSGGAVLYVRTPYVTGPMSVKDTVRLKDVELWNGTRWTQMVDAWPAESHEGALELELRSGERIGCTLEHLWPTQRGLIRADELRVDDVLQATTLPAPDTDVAVALDAEVGWLIGTYLADGCIDDRNNLIRIASHADETERRDRLAALAARFHASFRWYSKGGKSASGDIRSAPLCAVIRQYVGGANAGTKHLTMYCWERSNDFLDAVLHGYLEGDGHYDAPNDRWRLGFKANPDLAVSLRTLCARLGAECRIRARWVMYDGRPYATYRGEVRFARRAPAAIPGAWQARPNTEIVAIRKSRARKFWDIEVADDPHLFALASGVLTHNCMPESVEDRPVSAVETLFLLSKSEDYFYDHIAVRKAAVGATRVRKDRFGGNKHLDAAGKHSEQSTFVNATARNRRNSDWFFESLAAILDDRKAQLVVEDEGAEHVPAAFVINTKPFKGAHFAVAPEWLVQPCILSGTSERGGCAACGAPWKRVTQHTPMVFKHSEREDAAKEQGRVTALHGNLVEPAKTVTTGWEPTCDCKIEETEPQIVLDPFSGSGTVVLVGRKLGRRGIGIDASEPYTKLATDRLAAAGFTASAVPPAEPQEAA